MNEPDKEVVEGILQTFPDAFQYQYGEAIDLKDLDTFLKSLLSKRKTELMERAFSNLNTHNLRLMIEMIGKKQSNTSSNTLTKTSKSKK